MRSIIVRSLASRAEMTEVHLVRSSGAVRFLLVVLVVCRTQLPLHLRVYLTAYDSEQFISLTTVRSVAHSYSWSVHHSELLYFPRFGQKLAEMAFKHHSRRSSPLKLRPCGDIEMNVLLLFFLNFSNILYPR